MTGICTKCGKLFEGSDEDTSGPDVMCADCFNSRPHPRNACRECGIDPCECITFGQCPHCGGATDGTIENPCQCLPDDFVYNCETGCLEYVGKRKNEPGIHNPMTDPRSGYSIEVTGERPANLHLNLAIETGEKGYWLIYVRNVFRDQGGLDWVDFKLYGHVEHRMSLESWRNWIHNARNVKRFNGCEYVTILNRG